MNTLNIRKTLDLWYILTFGRKGFIFLWIFLVAVVYFINLIFLSNILMIFTFGPLLVASFINLIYVFATGK